MGGFPQHSRRYAFIAIARALSFIAAVCLSAHASQVFAAATETTKIDCLMCHEDLTKGPSVHAAVQMGCEACHSAINAADIPHKTTNGIPKGLSAKAPELCYQCHDTGKFTRKIIHLAVGMGCSECHNPHSSKNPKLLTSASEELCFKCHAKALFNKRNVHAPVAAGTCLACHDPHSTDHMDLLTNDPMKLCLDCHAQVAKLPHTSAAHSLGNADEQDPKRPSKPFYCGSCHNPHTSMSPRLFRYRADSEMDLCTYCHNF